MSRPLDPRLLAVAEAVRPGAVAADIGTDHGYLICALVGGGKCPRGYAADVRPLPLEAARGHIRERGLEDRIVTVLSDGLRELPGGEIDDVILVGMGGELIGELLTAVPWTRNPDKRFVLQPMSRAAHLRRLLCREGFTILAERAAESGRFVYTVMTAAYTGERRRADDLFAETGLLPENRDAVSRRYLEQVRARLQKQAAGIARAKGRGGEAAGLRALAERITERINEGQS